MSLVAALAVIAIIYVGSSRRALGVRAIVASNLSADRKGELLLPFIRQGMSRRELEEILGEPQEIQGGFEVIRLHYAAYKLRVLCDRKTGVTSAEFYGEHTPWWSPRTFLDLP